MTVEYLRSRHRAQPFKPFTSHVADGASYEVTHPENLFQTQGGRTLFLNTHDEEVVTIDLLLVTRITQSNGSTGTRKRR